MLDAMYEPWLIASATTEWLTAIGTVATAVVAVGVAIGLQWWTADAEKRKAPVLTLERDESWFSNETGWPRIRLAVRNATGQRAATDVQVSVEVVTEGQGGGGVMRRPSNMTLPWSNIFDPAIALRPMAIPAGGRRYVDLGSFIDFTRPGETDRPVFEVSARTGGVDYLHDPPCRFELTVSAANVDVTPWRAELHFEPSKGEPKKPMNVGVTLGRA